SWALPAAGTIDAAGNPHFAWAGYQLGRQNVNLYISGSEDEGETWTSTLVDVSGAAPACTAYRCGWSYLGAQIAMASDSAGTLYALWTSSRTDRAPQKLFFASSTTFGATWSAKLDLSGSLATVEHAFPGIVASAAGDVRIAWMDTRTSPRWNTFYRSSTNGGATWSAETRLSGGAAGYRYIHADGFGFPFGDYFGMAIDNRGETHVVWGEGLNFNSPGSIWHTSGR
ncbi:MAG: exo-alpha-sialidase, partial [Acidobacteriales bacterium]|nr:exo-alpha-sialidase [Terriglobales bacterium]